jgi:hypothetical protein
MGVDFTNYSFKVIPRSLTVSGIEFSLLEEFCMKYSKFTDTQVMDALKRVDAGFAVPDVCRELGISSAIFYKWRPKYGGMDTSMMDRMKQL